MDHRVGECAPAIPIVVQGVNKAAKTRFIRKAMERVVGVHAERRLPPYAAKRFHSVAPKSV